MKPLIASNKISDGQKQASIQLIVDAVRKATGVTIDELSDNGAINSQNLQRVISQGDKIVSAVTALVKEKIAELAQNATSRTKLISGAETLELDETDGKATIAEAKDTFPGDIDCDFEYYGTNVSGPATKKTQVTVHEKTKSGTLTQIFGGMSDNLNSLCFTQPQIIQFVQKHKKWLRTDSYGTFFLFKVVFNKGTSEEREEFFVAHVVFGSDGLLKVRVCRFSHVYVVSVEGSHQFVVPQLEPVTS